MALLIDFRLYSSMIIKTLSLPEKNIKGIWQARTIRNITLSKYDSQSPPETLKLFRILSSIADPKKNTPRNAINMYITLVILIAQNKAELAFFGSEREFTIGNSYI